jgi:methylenetetrahydrofolate--tRNA-(uracil-5-)-methyltransferase
MSIRVVGAGLAGCEAAWQIAGRGISVDLFEMKPLRFSPAHSSGNFAELVCSNSLKAERVESAAGLLKEEMRRLGSLLVPCAYECRVPAGGALAVDRDEFAKIVTEKIRSHPLIHVHTEEVTELPSDGVSIIATGPLTSAALAEKISALCGGSLSFYDAAAPIVTAESLNMERIFSASRYGRGGDDAYLNCPMNREEYEAFYQELVTAERAPLHGFDAADPKVYEGCMPVEVMAGRGGDTLRFGPMKPVGLRDPQTGHRPWAVLQLRREDAQGSLYNLVGFQTNLKFGEQKRVFGMIPGLEHAEFVRYGVMHRNTFLDSPLVLSADFSLKQNPNLFFAGQITGVEGYMESAASGS